MNENSLIKDIGRSYIVSSMLPAALFITLGVFIYRANIPQLLSTSIISDQFSASLYFLFAGFIMWAGFALYSMVNWTVRFYEGYYVPSWLKEFIVFLCFRWVHRKKTRYIKKVIKANKEKSANWGEIIDQNYDRAWADYSDVELSGPMREEDLLPTRLGNVLRGSEKYPEKYGLTAGIDLWTRLATVLPPNIANTLEEKNNNMLFLLNSSLLSYIMSIFAFWNWGSCKVNQSCSTTLTLIKFIDLRKGLSSCANGLAENEFLILGFVWIFVGYVLYILSIPVAKTMGLLIRSSFDLYRFDLLKQLNYSIPRTLTQEKKIWQKISDFIVTGGNLGVKPLEFKYNLRSELLPSKPLTKSSRSRKSIKKKKA